MRIQNIYCLMLIAGSVAIAGCTSTTQKAAKQSSNAYVGAWDGKESTSIEIITENPLVVRYCFKTKCNNHKPTGTIDNLSIIFPQRADRGKSTMNAVKTETGYNATFQSEGATVVYTATLTKPATTPAPAESALKPAQ